MLTYKERSFFRDNDNFSGKEVTACAAFSDAVHGRGEPHFHSVAPGKISLFNFPWNHKAAPNKMRFDEFQEQSDKSKVAVQLIIVLR